MNPAQKKQLLEERRGLIGGSDAMHLLGIEYGCERRLWYDKKEVMPDYPFQGNADTERGEALEHFAVVKFCQATGCIDDAPKFFRHPRVPVMGQHADRVIYRRFNDARAEVNPGILEVKCPRTQNYFKMRREGPSLAAQTQLQWGLSCSGYAWGAIVAFSGELWAESHWDFERDEEMIADLEAAAAGHAKKWGLAENPFPRLDITDPRCRACPWRTKCQGLGEVYYEPGDLPDKDDPDEEDEGIVQVYAAFLDARRRHKDAEALLESVKQDLIDRLGARPRKVRCSLGRAVYTQRERAGYAVKPSRFMELRVVPNRKEVTDGEIDAFTGE